MLTGDGAPPGGWGDGRPYIGQIIVSPQVGQKIIALRGVSEDDVRDAVQAPARYERAQWHLHDEYGWRLLVLGTATDGRRLKVILQPVDPTDGTWRLRTVLVTSTKRGA